MLTNITQNNHNTQQNKQWKQLKKVMHFDKTEQVIFLVNEFLVSL